jgi:hypothetical protein
MSDNSQRPSRYIKKEGGGFDPSLFIIDAPTGTTVSGTQPPPRLGSLRQSTGISLNMATPPSFAPRVGGSGTTSVSAPLFTPNIGAARKQLDDKMMNVAENTSTGKFKPKSDRRPRKERQVIQPKRSFETVGLIPDEELLTNTSTELSAKIDQKKKIEEKKHVQKKNPFAGNKYPPITVPFRDDIVDEEKDYRPQVEKTQQEIDAEALEKQKEMFRMGKDNIIASDELFFIQLPSSLPIDVDKVRQEQIAQQTAYLQQQVKQLQKSGNTQESNKTAIQALVKEHQQKIAQLKKEAELSKKKYSASVDEDENIWTVPFTNTLTSLPSGLIGEMLVYKSGKIKLKLGDVFLDVSPGTEFSFQEQVAYISAAEKEYYMLGDIKSHLTCTPDIEYLLKKNKS